LKTSALRQPIFIRYMRYTSLNVLGMIGLSCYILADTFFIAQGVGSAGLTALNLAIPAYSLMHGAGLMIGMGGATRYALSAASGDEKRKNAAFTAAVWFAGGLAALFLLCGMFFAAPIARLLGADGETAGMTAEYLRVLLVFAPMFLFNNVIGCFVRNDGRPNLAMAAMLIGSFSNIVLDYILVFPLRLGIFGAALATGLSPVIGLGILSTHFFRRHSHFSLQKRRPRLREIFDLCALGGSTFVSELSSGVVILVFNMVILGLCGNIGVAAYGVIANVYIVVVSVFTGIAQGIQPLVSESCGRGRPAEMRRIFRYAVVTALLLAAIFYILSYIWTDPLVAVFNRDRDATLAALAGRGLRLYFTAFGFVGFNILTAAYLSAADRAGAGFTVSLLRGFIVIVPAVLLLSRWFGMDGVWLSLCTAEGGTALAAGILYLHTRGRLSAPAASCEE
jgi:putative MATE family efflux protein